MAVTVGALSKAGVNSIPCPQIARTPTNTFGGPKAKPAQDPGMVLHYLMAKDGPGKDAVSHAFGKVKPKQGKASPKDLEELDYNRLDLALRSGM